MKCRHCNKEVTLVPSASARAAKFGGEAQDYVRLFSYHTRCQLEIRAKATSELITRLKSYITP